MVEPTAREDNIVYDIAYAKTMMLPLDKDYMSIDELRLDVFSWVLNHGSAMRVVKSVTL